VFLCKPWAPFFEVKQRWAPFSPGFSGPYPRFLANQNFWGCACNPCTPMSNTTAFHNSIIGNFMVHQDRLETNLLQLFRHPEISVWFSKISVIIFEVNIIDEQKQTQLVTIFYKPALPPTVLLPTLPYRTVARKFSIGALRLFMGAWHSEIW